MELPEPDLHIRCFIRDDKECRTPQWILPLGIIPLSTITACPGGVKVGEDFHEDLPGLRALALATLAAVEWVEQRAPEAATTEAAERSG